MRTDYMNAYMSNRRASNPLQKFQDRKDALKARILNAKTWETLNKNIEAYGQACIELNAARLLFKKTK